MVPQTKLHSITPLAGAEYEVVIAVNNGDGWQYHGHTISEAEAIQVVDLRHVACQEAAKVIPVVKGKIGKEFKAADLAALPGGKP